MKQINAGLVKEWIYLLRSFKFLGIVITFAACAVFMPLMSALMLMVDDMDIFAAAVTNIIPVSSISIDAQGMDAMLDMYRGESGLLISYIGSLSMFADGAVLAVMLFMMGTAGGEQKKRSIIIPQTAGLTPSGYVFPKFLLYPILIVVFTIASSFFTNFVCGLIFEISFPV
jgi:ABC-2 type transport system permease protein